MPPSSWKDYANNGNGHHTNYAYEPFEADPRGMPPLPQGPRGHGGHPHHHHPQMPSHPNGSLQKPRPSSGSYSRSYTQQHSAPPAGAGYSLPRHSNGSGGYGGPMGGPPPPPPGYGSYDRRGYNRSYTQQHSAPVEFPPDHYFMPSQRKYSGEVVRVFVDYNNK